MAKMANKPNAKPIDISTPCNKCVTIKTPVPNIKKPNTEFLSGE
jgi:hypothetical protein